MPRPCSRQLGEKTAGSEERRNGAANKSVPAPARACLEGSHQTRTPPCPTLPVLEDKPMNLRGKVFLLVPSRRLRMRVRVRVQPFKSRRRLTAAFLSWGTEPCRFSKTGILGAPLSGAGLQSWGTCCGVQTPPSSGRSSALRFFPLACCHVRIGDFGETASQPLLTGSVWRFPSLP